jgi:hypothetical protein
MDSMKLYKFNGKERITFGVDGTRSLHKMLMDRFRQSDDLRNFEAIPGFEHE